MKQAPKTSSEYLPLPEDLSDILLPPQLVELTEILARNTHENWSWRRMAEGWRYGPVRDDIKKEHPGLIPYEALPDSEKDYDRATAMNAIKLILKLGFRIV